MDGQSSLPSEILAKFRAQEKMERLPEPYGVGLGCGGLIGAFVFGACLLWLSLSGRENAIGVSFGASIVVAVVFYVIGFWIQAFANSIIRKRRATK